MTFEAPDTHPAKEWSEEDFVRRWVAGDSMAAILDFPRRITTTLVQESALDVRRVVDVGSGPGEYLRVLLEEFPKAEGVWVDASETMLEQAQASLADLGSRVSFKLRDMRDSASLPLDGDVIVTSRAVHHFTPATIQDFYRACAEALTSGGFLFNLDHFATPGDWRERYRAVKSRLIPKSGGGTSSHSHDAPPQLLDEHLEWLRSSGFVDPDIPWRLFWTALVVARVR